MILIGKDRHDSSHSKAAERYKKLLSRPCHVQKLETRDGALLCGDDLLKDVIDDKEILGLNIKDTPLNSDFRDDILKRNTLTILI